MDLFFDESGNTGGNLLDRDQLLFILASTSLSERDSDLLLRKIKNQNKGEFKYSSIKKSKKHFESILSILADECINKKTVKLYIIDKRFTLLTKLIDEQVEPLFYEKGIDFYAGRFALKLANLLETCLPVFLGSETYATLLSVYSKFAKEPSPDSFQRFAKEVYNADEYLTSNKSEIKSTFNFLVSACDRGFDFAKENLGSLKISAHDPWLPSFIQLIQGWMSIGYRNITIIHDDAKVISENRDIILKLSDPKVAPLLSNHYNQKYQYPLLLNKIRSESSRYFKSIQLADFFAGAANQAFISLLDSSKKYGEIETEIRNLLFKKELIQGAIWRSSNVTSEEVEATGDPGICPLEYITKILAKDPSIYRE